LRGVEQDAAADNDLSRVGLGQPGNTIEKSGFAGARRAEQDGEARGGVKVSLQNKVLRRSGELLSKIGLE
jgi:hypothetical protein